MRKLTIGIGVSMVLILAACNKNETVVVEDSIGVRGDYGYGDAVILDAIIDTEAEYEYFKEIHKEYEQLRADYTSARNYVSAVLSRGNAEEVGLAKQQISTFRTAMENFKTKIDGLTLPTEYGRSLSEAMSYYIQLMNNEIGRLVDDSGTSNVKNNEDSESMTEKEFKKAEQVNRTVQENYLSILKKR